MIYSEDRQNDTTSDSLDYKSLIDHLTPIFSYSYHMVLCFNQCNLLCCSKAGDEATLHASTTVCETPDLESVIPFIHTIDYGYNYISGSLSLIFSLELFDKKKIVSISYDH